MRIRFTGTAAAVAAMNSLGANGTPFLFIASFSGDDWFVAPLAELNTGEVLWAVREASNSPAVPERLAPPALNPRFMSYERYLAMFARVKEEIHAGNTYLLNLSAETRLDAPLNLREIFFSAAAPYKLHLRGLFTLFSPETFVTIDAGRISTHPMKGTIDAAIPGAREIILHDRKETAEHYTIVDLLRNDLGIAAQQITVENFRYIDTIATTNKKLLQVSSRITGVLGPRWQKELGTTIAALLPAGSVTGAPKKKTVEIIRAVEGYERGFYTGVFGVFNGTRLDSAVMIRFIEQKPDGFVFKSGGGITMFSSPEKEYSELKDKVYVPLA